MLSFAHENIEIWRAQERTLRLSADSHHRGLHTRGLEPHGVANAGGAAAGGAAARGASGVGGVGVGGSGVAGFGGAGCFGVGGDGGSGSGLGGSGLAAELLAVHVRPRGPSGDLEAGGSVRRERFVDAIGVCAAAAHPSRCEQVRREARLVAAAAVLASMRAAPLTAAGLLVMGQEQREQALGERVYAVRCGH